MHQQPLHVRLDLTLPVESQGILSEFIEGCVRQALGKPGQKAGSLLPHQSPHDVELEDGVQLLVDTRQACKLLKVSAKTLYTLYTQKRMPEPIRLGGTFVRWSLAELIEWSMAGCPPQSEWSYPPRRK
jgi:predicted DNA-binding transcriptional regulator AlpA